MTASNSADSPGDDAIGDPGADARRDVIDGIVRRAIGASGGSDNLVDLS